ncbi:MAG TPA: hypothetical protein VHE30_03470 [Polyangiaceae bacterium]|nr:hypothetical protein [Polyangiaceae bacterium]
MRSIALGLATALVLGACSSSNDGSSGSAATGGAPSGGAGAGDGGSGASGAGAPNGGTSNGGTSNGGASNGGASNGGASNGGTSSGGGGAPPAGACALDASRIRITETDLDATVDQNEDEAALKPLVLSPIPGGGSRLAWMSGGMVHVSTLGADDAASGSSLALPAHDFADLHADAQGGAILLTRDAEGGGTLNCGDPGNLCGVPPDPPIPCFDMYLVRFDGSAETWATRLTDSSSALPPYSTGPTGGRVYMIWWYAHHGRIAFDGSRYASYFGAAISVSQGGCINIHQGDRMKIVDGSGALVDGGFDWGCSHSGYERIVWDEALSKFVTVCKTDNQNRIAFSPNVDTIYPVDLAYSNLGNLVLGKNGGYFLTTSNARAGEPPGADGLADVHLLHFTTGTPDSDVIVASDAGLNDRAPHLAAYGADRMIAAWETSSTAGDLPARGATRTLHVQTRSRVTGDAEGDAVDVDVRGNRYQDFVAFPDGSVAYAAPGSSATKVKILRILPCEG